MRGSDALESLAVETHLRAGSDPARPETVIFLARSVLGAENLRTAGDEWFAPNGDGLLLRVRGTWQAWVRRGISPERLAFAVAHELAEFLLLDTSLSNEESADYLAAALIAPAPFFRKIARAPVLGELARRIVTTETMIALRWGEVVEQPTLVVTRSHAWTRGREFAWPKTPDAHPGLKKIEIQDNPGRKAFLAK